MIFSFYICCLRQYPGRRCSARTGRTDSFVFRRLRSHWVTPESEARRYDTYFFLARLPKGQHADGRTSEAVEAAWIAPGEALMRFDAGLLKLVPPTISNLTSIVAATSVDEAWNTPFDGHVRPHPVARPCGEVVLGCEVSET